MIPIPQYEKQYAIHEDGAVVRLETGRVLVPCLNKQTGYLYVSLWKDNRGKTYSVHRLVAQVYLPNPENKPEVNHKDSVRTNPHKDNLEWCTRLENIRHGYDEGFMSQEARRNFKEFELEVLLQTVLSGETLTTVALAEDVGLSRLSINLRRKAKEMGLEDAYNTELYRQRCIRNIQANAAKQRPVLQLTPDGVFIAEHISVTAAGKALGKSSSGSISNALNPLKDQQLAFGYKWKFK